MDVGDIINQYLEEANLDTDLDRLEVINTQERLVNNKHKWSARLINHKINLNNLKFKKESALEDKVTEFQNTEPVRVSRSIAERAVRNKKEIRALDVKIKNEQLIIDYLENIYKNISFATNDVKNLVELMKLETQ
jgi:hypothetical protein